MAKPKPCTPDRLGTFIGARGDVLATISTAGQLSAVTDLPCESQTKEVSSIGFPFGTPIQLTRPISVVGLKGDLLVETEFSAIAGTFGDGYGLCKSKKKCESFDTDIFISRSPGLPLTRINMPGHVENVSNRVWIALEEHLKSQYSRGLICGKNQDQDVAIRITSKSVQKLKLPSKNQFALAILEMATQKGASISSISLVSEISAPVTLVTFCSAIQASSEIRHLLAIEHSRYKIIYTMGEDEHYFISLKPDGSVASRLTISNGNQEAD